MFRVEVQADNTGTWAGNGLTFPTVEEAKKYAKDLFCRWTAVREWRILRISTAAEGGMDEVVEESTA
jgi:hypothetical protein